MEAFKPKMRCHIIGLLIWGYTIYLCHKNRMSSLHWINLNNHTLLFSEQMLKHREIVETKDREILSLQERLRAREGELSRAREDEIQRAQILQSAVMNYVSKVPQSPS